MSTAGIKTTIPKPRDPSNDLSNDDENKFCQKAQGFRQIYRHKFPPKTIVLRTLILPEIQCQPRFGVLRKCCNTKKVNFH